MEYNLVFRGYWLDSRVSNIPHTSGVYLVYKCLYSPVADTVTLLELIYIGQAEDLNERLKTHERKPDFERECRQGEMLCYSVAEVAKEDLNVVEAGLIFAQGPKLNEEGKENFNYSVPVFFRLEGRCGLMEYHNFSIKEK